MLQDTLGEETKRRIETIAHNWDMANAARPNPIERILIECGWHCVDEVFRYWPTGRVVPFDRIMRAMPKYILDELVGANAEDRFERDRRPAKRGRQK